MPPLLVALIVSLISLAFVLSLVLFVLTLAPMVVATRKCFTTTRFTTSGIPIDADEITYLEGKSKVTSTRPQAEKQQEAEVKGEEPKTEGTNPISPKEPNQKPNGWFVGKRNWLVAALVVWLIGSWVDTLVQDEQSGQALAAKEYAQPSKGFNEASMEKEYPQPSKGFDEASMEIMKGWDTDKDGMVSLMELVDNMQNNPEVGSMLAGKEWHKGFRAADANNDMHLNADELKSFLAKTMS